jgi:hypothetical protein
MVKSCPQLSSEQVWWGCGSAYSNASRFSSSFLDTESLSVALQRPGLSLVERSEVAPENVFPEFASGVLEQAVNAGVELTVQDALEAAASGVQLFC